MNKGNVGKNTPISQFPKSGNREGKSVNTFPDFPIPDFYRTVGKSGNLLAHFPSQGNREGKCYPPTGGISTGSRSIPYG